MPFSLLRPPPPPGLLRHPSSRTHSQPDGLCANSPDSLAKDLVDISILNNLSGILLLGGGGVVGDLLEGAEEGSIDGVGSSVATR